MSQMAMPAIDLMKQEGKMSLYLGAVCVVVDGREMGGGR